MEPQEAGYGDQERHTGPTPSGPDPKEVFSKDGLFDELKKALAERPLHAELDDHLENEVAAGKGNHRNGYSKETVPFRRLVEQAVAVGPAPYRVTIDTGHAQAIRQRD